MAPLHILISLLVVSCSSLLADQLVACAEHISSQGASSSSSSGQQGADADSVEVDDYDYDSEQQYRPYDSAEAKALLDDPNTLCELLWSPLMVLRYT